MKHFYVGAMMLSIGLLLSACGGGGGGRGGPSATPVPIELSASQVRAQVAGIGRAADRLLMTDLPIWYGDGGTDASTRCPSLTMCDSATDEFSIYFTPERVSEIPQDAQVQMRGTRQGVSLVEYSGQSASLLHFGLLDNVAIDYQSLGGWMEYSFFSTNLWKFERTGWQLWGSASTGIEAGSNPISGSVVWTGAMVGRVGDLHGNEEPGSRLIGDSRLTFDFVQNDLDVVLTDIRADDGTSYADLTWENVPTRNGLFASGGLQGAFYGPNHEEVGGVFDSQQGRRIVGAFGASR